MTIAQRVRLITVHVQHQKTEDISVNVTTVILLEFTVVSTRDSYNHHFSTTLKW